jgi:quinol monooxygenase YgiN
MIVVLVTVEVEDGRREGFLEEFARIVPLVRAEAGCIEYGPAVDVETGLEAQDGPRDNVVTIVEKWESLEHLKAHLAAPHMIEYRPKVKPLIASTRLHVLRPV